MKNTTELIRDQLQKMRGTRGGWSGVAARSGCSYFTIARIARGNYVPRADTADKILAALDSSKPVAE